MDLHGSDYRSCEPADYPVLLTSFTCIVCSLEKYDASYDNPFRDQFSMYHRKAPLSGINVYLTLRKHHV